MSILFQRWVRPLRLTISTKSHTKTSETRYRSHLAKLILSCSLRNWKGRNLKILSLITLGPRTVIQICLNTSKWWSKPNKTQSRNWIRRGSHSDLTGMMLANHLTTQGSYIIRAIMLRITINLWISSQIKENKSHLRLPQHNRSQRWEISWCLKSLCNRIKLLLTKSCLWLK